MAELPVTTFFCAVLAQGEGGGGDLLSMMLPFILLMGGMWFLLIAPQRKMQKEQEKMISELKVGDEILTKGGIIGTITSVKAERLMLKVAENTKIELSRVFVQSVLKKKGEKAKGADSDIETAETAEDVQK